MEAQTDLEGGVRARQRRHRAVHLRLAPKMSNRTENEGIGTINSGMGAGNRSIAIINGSIGVVNGGIPPDSFAGPHRPGSSIVYVSTGHRIAHA
eukprot:1636782-Rhodomonas_salina.1